MATYNELHALRGSAALSSLREKINVAIAVKANALAKGTPTATQAAWAKSALQSPDEYRETVLNYILAEYNTAAASAIQNATDAQVQAATNSAVDTLLGA